MGVQLFPALEGYDQDYFFSYSDGGDWKSIPHKIDELNKISNQLNIQQILTFFNATRDEVDFDTEDFENGGELIDGAWYYQGSFMWSIEPQWFDPKQGLVMILGLLEYLRSTYPEIDLSSPTEWTEEHDFLGVIYELEAMSEILIQAQQEKKRFRLLISG